MKTVLLMLFFMVLAGLLLLTAGSVQAAAEKLVGSEACMECHEDAYDSYMRNRHSIAADPRTPAARIGCESCHGPGSEHVDSEGEGGIRSLRADSKRGAADNNAACLKCHSKGGKRCGMGVSMRATTSHAPVVIASIKLSRQPFV